MRIEAARKPQLFGALAAVGLGISASACVERNEFGERMPTIAELESDELTVFLAPSGSTGRWTELKINPDNTYRITRVVDPNVRYNTEGYRGELADADATQIRDRLRLFFPPRSGDMHSPTIPSGCALAADGDYAAYIIFGDAEQLRIVAIDHDCDSLATKPIYSAIQYTFGKVPQLADGVAELPTATEDN